MCDTLSRNLPQKFMVILCKTQRGAFAGGLYMSLIYTCMLCGSNPVEYLPFTLISERRHVSARRPVPL